MTNIEIAQLISERIGQSPIPHNDIRNISYEIYQELGGESELEDFEDIYELLLTILPMAREGGVGIIDDTSIRTDKTWSSNKINSELSSKQNTLTAGQNITINGTTISANVDLSNYYNKGETDTLLNEKQDMLIAGQNIVITNNTISAVIDAGFHIEVVQTLPATGEVNTIYLVPKAGGVNPDVYDEYMYINNTWEHIGSTEVDLSNYYNKTEVDTLLSGKQATLTAGNNITINGTTISANDTTYSASDNIDITNNAIKAVGYRYDTSNGAFAEGDRDIDESGTIRNQSVATGVMAHAEGCDGTASGNHSHTEGNLSSSVGNNSHAEGYTTTSTGTNSHAEGRVTNAIGNNSHAEGNTTTTRGVDSHAEGYNNETGGNYTSNTKTAGTETGAGAYAHAEGNATIATGIASHSEGKLTLAKSANSHAENFNTITNGVSSHAEGYQSETGGNYTSNTKTAGGSTEAGAYAHAEGNATIANGIAAHAEGKLTLAKTDNSHTEGQLTTTIDNAGNAHAEGYKSTSRGYASHTEGYDTETGGNYASATSNPKTAGTNTSVAAYSHAEGNATIAYGIDSHSEGRKTFAKGSQSHSEGSNTIAVGVASHAEGAVSTANGNVSHVEGRSTISNNTAYASHAEGYDTETGGNYTTNTKTAGTDTGAGAYAHAEGNATIANGVAAHSEGINTLAKGKASHAEGQKTVANGENSHAEGALSVANNYNSHAEGRATKTFCNGEHSEGSYNVSHYATGSFDGNAGNTVHSTGIGAGENARKNAVEVMQNGDAYLFGVGNYDGVHIKGETGAPSGLQTLQETVNGKQDAITAGNNIDITNNTISALGYEYNSSSDSITNGAGCFADGENSHAEGYQCYTLNDATASHAEGVETETNNINEHAQGRYNVSHSVDATLTQHEGNTVVSVGIGENGERKNAFEIMQNGDIYVYGVGYYDGTATKYDDPTVMTLQDIIKAIADNTGIDLGVLF